MNKDKPEDIQSWDTARYESNARFVSDLGLPVVELLAPELGERILDLGCGDGVLTAKLRDMGVQVLGVDTSSAFVEAALELGLNAQLVDGHDLKFEREFDAVFSNAALHWMNRPDEVLAGVVRALKPDGRFVGEFGGHLNVATVRTALYAAVAKRGIDPRQVDPWYFPSPAAYCARLEAHGFQVKSIELIPRPTPLPGDLSGWLATFAECFLNTLPENQRDETISEIVELTRPMLQDETGLWTADYYRLRFSAELAG